MRAAAAAIGTEFAPKELEAMQFRGEPFWLAYRAPSANEAEQWMNFGLLPRAPRPRLERRYVSAAQPGARRVREVRCGRDDRDRAGGDARRPGAG